MQESMTSTTSTVASDIAFEEFCHKLGNRRRVVVTGFGAVTPLGANVTDSWRNLIECKSGIIKIPESLFAHHDITSKIAGVASDFDALKCMSSKTAHISDRFMHLAIAACAEAIDMSNWRPVDEYAKERTAVIVGSGIGGVISIEKNSLIAAEEGARFISPYFIPASLINLISGHISIIYGYKGLNLGVVSACSTGAHSIGEAMHMIRANRADVVICGGSEAALSRVGVAGFASARALSTKFNDDPTAASRPWDSKRDGFVIAEGAGVLVLEDLEHAIRRNATIYGEIVGYGASSDAYHITAPLSDGSGALRAMQSALKDANFSPAKIDYINAHGTSTPLGDMIEYRAVEKLFEGYKTDNLAMSSTKSSIGHSLGAAGAIEAIFSLLAINNGIIPATLNLDSPEEGLSINLVPHKPITRDISVAMSNSFGFGGTNASIIMQKYHPESTSV